ncbi:type II toxin-antitoxin system VapC family toxin [Candidatus Bathyarchaeota archaeon]|nr:type II toxin-antitoxin system VapC family toxin [Candidatus Bathyarchaeota archaeon]
MNYVIDTSVAAKLFIKEDHSDKAKEIFEEHVSGYLKLLAPKLLTYELGNVFLKHPQIDHGKAYIFIKKFMELKVNLIDVFSDDDLLKNICYLSKSKNITFYDAAFIAIAEKYETKLITADDHLYKKAPEISIIIKIWKKYE